MQISLDYDNTYTNDPELWDMFIILCLSRGHKVTVVTKREPQLGTPTRAPFTDEQLPRIYTSRTAKRGLMPEGTVWIDDSPEGILWSDRQMLGIDPK